MDDRDLLRYSRHILLEEIGIDGQEKLLAATVLVVGCGGLGCAALPYLAASGIGHLIIADDDTVNDTNLQRQICFTETDTAKAKAVAMQDHLQALNGRVRISALKERLSETRLSELAEKADIILDCCDNFATRQATNRAAIATRKPLVSGAAAQFEGQLSVYRPDLPDTPCYACLFDGNDFSDEACATFGVFSPLVGIIGATQAAEALKILTGIGAPSHSSLRIYDALSGQWQHFSFSKNPECRVCGLSDRPHPCAP